MYVRSELPKVWKRVLWRILFFTLWSASFASLAFPAVFLPVLFLGTATSEITVQQDSLPVRGGMEFQSSKNSLDASSISQLLGQIKQETTKKGFKTADEIEGLLRAKKFKEAKAMIEDAREVEGWVVEVAFNKLSRIPLYSTDERCRTVAVKYEGQELEELLQAAIKRFDINRVTPRAQLSPNPRNPSIASFLDGLFGLVYNSPACFDKQRLVKVIAFMLDHGLKAKFWGEDCVGSYESKFSSIMRLGDISLAKRILKEGMYVARENWVCLFARAPTMEMVRLLESHGYTLHWTEYEKIFELPKKFPEKFSDFLRWVEPEVIQYYKSKLK